MHSCFRAERGGRFWFEPRASLCIHTLLLQSPCAQMAMSNKRLQGKTTFAKTDHSELLAGNFTNWTIFLLQDHGKLHYTGFVHCNGFTHRVGNWRCMMHFRIINKTCREIWDDVFQVRLHVPYGYGLARLREAFPRESMIFYRFKDTDTPNKILSNNKGKGCVLTVPWQAFINFAPVLTLAVSQDVILHMPSSHYLVSYAAHAFSLDAQPDYDDWGLLERDEIDRKKCSTELAK